MREIMICQECGTKLELMYTYSDTRNGIIETTRGYECKNCGHNIVKSNRKAIK